MPDALAKIYEITAFLDIALLAALVTVYAIIISLMGEMLRWFNEKLNEFEAKKADTQKEFNEMMEALRKEGGNPNITIKKLKKEWEAREKELKKEERPFRKRERRLSLGWILTTGGLILVSFASILIATLTINTSCSLIPYSIGTTLLLWVLISIALTLKEASQLARGFTPKGKEAFEELLEKLIEEIGLKKPEFKIHFEVDDKIVDTLRIKKGEEQGACLVVDNDSRFPVKDTVVELALPAGFALRRRTQDTPAPPRPATIDPYPGGAALRVELQTLPSETSQRIRFLIKGENAGTFEMIVWVYSTTHERHPTTLNVIVEE